jgi:hypothetical protein
MLIVETHPTQQRAELSRQAFVAAQRLIDRVAKLVTGDAFDLPAEEVFDVFAQNGEWVVVYLDPSVPEGVEVRSEMLYDCGD